jgi:hypothetical protein
MLSPPLLLPPLLPDVAPPEPPRPPAPPVPMALPPLPVAPPGAPPLPTPDPPRGVQAARAIPVNNKDQLGRARHREASAEGIRVQYDGEETKATGCGIALRISDPRREVWTRARRLLEPRNSAVAICDRKTEAGCRDMTEVVYVISVTGHLEV